MTAPLYAIHEINPFGNGKHAPADSIFTPTSETERIELLDLGAARELTEDEAKLFAPAPVAVVAEEPVPVKTGRAKKADAAPADDADPADSLG